jgi:hypothetical protein
MVLREKSIDYDCPKAMYSEGMIVSGKDEVGLNHQFGVLQSEKCSNLYKLLRIINCHRSRRFVYLAYIQKRSTAYQILVGKYLGTLPLEGMIT